MYDYKQTLNEYALEHNFSEIKKKKKSNQCLAVCQRGEESDQRLLTLVDKYMSLSIAS